jgi:hypothetical protein
MNSSRTVSMAISSALCYILPVSSFLNCLHVVCSTTNFVQICCFSPCPQCQEIFLKCALFPHLPSAKDFFLNLLFFSLCPMQKLSDQKKDKYKFSVLHPLKFLLLLVAFLLLFLKKNDYRKMTFIFFSLRFRLYHWLCLFFFVRMYCCFFQKKVFFQIFFLIRGFFCKVLLSF